MINLKKAILQLAYDCNAKDHESLELLQKQIQERINFLNEHELNSYADPKLLEYYELYSQIQQCLFQDHTDQYILIAAIIGSISFLVYFRWKMIKRVESSKKRFNFKG